MTTIMDLLEGIEFEIPKTKDNRYEHNGIPVPRVTEILQAMWHEDSLMKWANYLGFKRKDYIKELNYAADVGTAVHDSVEYFLANKEFPQLPPDFNIINAVNGFTQWYETVTKATSFEIISMEQKLTCPWFGGTYDCLAKINGKTCLIDFKTSKFIGIKYYMQLAAYRYILSLQGINIDIAMVLRLHKDEPIFSEYVVDLSVPESKTFLDNCFEGFLSLVYAYYNRQQLEAQFSKLHLGV